MNNPVFFNLNIQLKKDYPKNDITDPKTKKALKEIREAIREVLHKHLDVIADWRFWLDRKCHYLEDIKDE